MYVSENMQSWNG